MLDIRKRLFIFIGIGAGILLAVLFFIFAGKNVNIPKPPIFSFVPKAPVVEEPAVEPLLSPIRNAAPNPEPAVVVPSANASELYAKQLARLFVERYGTYSNQNDGKNIADAKDMSTDEMIKWLEGKVRPAGNVYAGITTKVVASSLESISEDNAIVRFDAQQKITGGAAGSAQKSGKVELLKVNGTWKVDGIYFE